jgi:uracil-DNA glycosylase
MGNMPQIKLVLLIGQYAQKYYLGKERKENLTETVKNYSQYLPKFFPLVHPSPRNRIWQMKNPWFEEEVVPALQLAVHALL